MNEFIFLYKNSTGTEVYAKVDDSVPGWMVYIETRYKNVAFIEEEVGLCELQRYYEVFKNLLKTYPEQIY